MQQFRTAIFSLLVLSVQMVWAQPPAGYYDPASGKTGAELKTALKQIIDNHTQLTYSELWNAFYDTDDKPNGKVWDMYSDIPGGTPPYEYTFGSDQCGNYSGEGSCYNREHSMPKSWFNDGYPMYTDLFQVVPTDGYVNNKRGNYPFGEVGNATWTSLNGSKVGSSDYPGYSGVVFEPIDEYKGDFARGYLYMATRYEDQIAGWNSDMLNGTSYPVFTTWALEMLIEWHTNDPVSEKETERNDAIYAYQNNRNPYIDHPEYVLQVWGNTPPVVFESEPDLTASPGIPYTYNIVTAGGNGNPISITCPVKPEWLSFSTFNDNTALLGGTPALADAGTHDVTLEATDGSSVATQTFSIVVSETASGLAFVTQPDETANPGKRYFYQMEARLNGETTSDVTYQELDIPGWLSLTQAGNGTAILSGTPDETHIGSHTIEISAIYNDISTLQSFTLEVLTGGQSEEFTETFELMPSNNSAYTTRTWTGDHDVNWTATEARTDQQINGRAICLDDSGEPYLQSESLTGNIVSLSFDHQQKFSGAGGTLTLFINDTQVGDPVEVTTEVGSASFTGITTTSEYTIQLVSNAVSRIAIDNLSWTTQGEETNNPIIETISHTPTQPEPGEQVEIAAEIIYPEGNIELVTLHYGTEPGIQNLTETMMHDQGNTYRSELTMPVGQSNIYYYVEVMYDAGNTIFSSERIIVPFTTQTYQLTISHQGSGSTTPAEGQHTFAANQSTELLATPDEGWNFMKWVINGSDETQNPFNFTMNSDVTAVAWFEPATRMRNHISNETDIYPNPFSGVLHFDHNHTETINIRIYNTMGRIVLEKATSDKMIQTDHLAPGIYFIAVWADDLHYSEKIIKNR